MAKNFVIEQLKAAFQGKEFFTKEELWDFYKQYEPDLLEGTLGWRIYHLKEKKVIRSLKRGVYTLSYKPAYKPEVENKQKELFLKVSKQFKDIKACIWSTKLLSEFMLHLPGRYTTFLEVESDATEAVFHFFKDINVKNVFLQPTEKEVEMYVYDFEDPIIIKSLVTKSPLQKQKKVFMPTLEKILVDVYAEKILLNQFQGSELIIIFNNAYQKYEINFSRLFTYAKRRGKEKELMDFMSSRTEISNAFFE